MHRTLPLAALATFAAFPVLADAVEDVCTDRNKSEAVCACAATALAIELHEDDYGLYEQVSANYLGFMAAGQDRGTAWNEALRTNATENERSFIEVLELGNRIGGMHARSIANCE